jgi:hypothetical protein
MIKVMNKLVTLIAMLFLIACNEDVKPIITLPEKKISKINFFMENSGSMAGYVQGATEFRNNIPNLLVEVDGKIDSGLATLRTYFIADSLVAFNGTTQEFINTIAVNNPAYGKSSQMHKIFKMIANKTDSNDISMFVSDCILSYPDAEIKRKPQINYENAAGELKSTITNAFLDLQQKNNICASLYGFNSRFNGYYYTYQNTPVKLSGNIPRPYYIWVIGNRDLLIRFNKQLKKLQGFRPDNIFIDFGLFSKSIEDYTILFMFDRQGDWSTDYKKLEEVSASAKKPAVFSIAFDLSSLPSYASDTNYLLKNLTIESSGLTAHIKRVLPATSIERSRLKEKEKGIIEKNTHVVQVEITDIFQSGLLNIRLPLQYDTSYRKQSVMDDRNVNDASGKTFAFEHLVDGVRNAYQNNDQNFIQISIPVKK